MERGLTAVCYYISFIISTNDVSKILSCEVVFDGLCNEIQQLSEVEVLPL